MLLQVMMKEDDNVLCVEPTSKHRSTGSHHFRSPIVA